MYVAGHSFAFTELRIIKSLVVGCGETQPTTIQKPISLRAEADFAGEHTTALHAKRRLAPDS